MDDFYTRQTYDWYGVKGDTIFIKIAYYDNNDDPINVAGFGLKFTLRDPITDDPILNLQKTRDGFNAVPTPNGIYCLNDTPVNFGMGIVNANEMVIHLTPEETKYLDKEIYEFDIEFFATGLYDSIFTQRGNLILNRDVTPNG